MRLALTCDQYCRAAEPLAVRLKPRTVFPTDADRQMADRPTKQYLALQVRQVRFDQAEALQSLACASQTARAGSHKLGRGLSDCNGAARFRIFTPVSEIQKCRAGGIRHRTTCN